MADVLLRDSVDQLRELLHAGKHSDALALGQHILHYFPKHVETYTLLAQTSLQVNDLAGATDLFRRVLSADPENVLALAGMALLSETQEKYDEALWYLERAYEVQPGNDDLRRELLRVRETFYGTAPARLELTAGALARVYARQGQYAHAVNEYRRLLRSDSKRYDARVGLAETLFRAGRTDEAAQMAQSVMADAPYALKPNLILGMLWSENAVPEGQQFLQRAQQLDPENRVAKQLLGERFANTQSPLLPPLGQAPGVSALDDNKIIGDVSTPNVADDAGARAAEFLRELERYQEPEAPPEQPLFGDFDALSLVEEIPTETIVTTAQQSETEAPAALAPAPPSVALPVETPNQTVVQAAPEVKPDADTRTPEEIALALYEAEVAQLNKETASAAGATTEQVQLPPEIFRAPVVDESAPAALAAPQKKTSDFAARLTRKSGEGLTAETLAAAANSLATSIALDKTSQPAPTRRNHPAIPKVRPVIRDAAEKLPTWLRLGSTPAAASATFEAAPPTSIDTITPITTPKDDRPAWLVEAQAAAAQESSIPSRAANELPDWLKPSGTVETAKPATEIPQTDVPAWLQDAASKDTAPPAIRASAQQQPLSAGLPEWLKTEPELAPLNVLASEPPPIGSAPVIPVESVAAPTEAALPSVPAVETVVAQMETALPPASIVEPIVEEPLATPPPLPEPLRIAEMPIAEPGAEDAKSEVAVEFTPAPVAEIPQTPAPMPEPIPQTEPEAVVQAAPVVEERAQTQAMPDSLTMLQMARDKRDSGDLKGALELYERVMHRRPNHLEQLTADLQAIIEKGDAPTSANRLLGEAYAMAGRFKESLAQYRIAMGK